MYQAQIADFENRMEHQRHNNFVGNDVSNNQQVNNLIAKNQFLQERMQSLDEQVRQYEQVVFDNDQRAKAMTREARHQALLNE